MLKEENVSYLLRSFQMILAVPSTRSTFRLLQNALMGASNGDQTVAQGLLESMLKGELKPGLAEGSTQEALKQLIAAFAIPITVAKEIFERGDFLNIITSDLLTQQKSSIYSNYVRRVDGEEFHFLTDVESTVQLLHHFAHRVKEMEKTPNNKEAVQKHRKALAEVRSVLKPIVSERRPAA